MHTFTTIQVATICEASRRVVIMWCDSGELPSHRSNRNNRERRIYADDLYAFMAARTATPEQLQLIAKFAGGVPQVGS